MGRQRCSAQDKACVNKAAEILGNKWTPAILYALSQGPQRFSALREGAGGPNPRTFSARLDALASAGIISKQSFSELPPRVEYALTPKGDGLVPILEKMRIWGEKYVPGAQASEE